MTSVTRHCCLAPYPNPLPMGADVVGARMVVHVDEPKQMLVHGATASNKHVHIRLLHTI